MKTSGATTKISSSSKGTTPNSNPSFILRCKVEISFITPKIYIFIHKQTPTFKERTFVYKFLSKNVINEQQHIQNFKIKP